jgi:16S rRNA (guanine(966)-N(2))-methyltransferase RsmD
MTLRLLGGEWKGRILKSPKSSPTRPTQGILRQAVFNICQHEVTDARFLDLFAGSGAMGLEALSRGAQRAVFVEQNRSAAECIRENIAIVQAGSRSELMTMDIFHALQRLARRKELFDIIYIDPPYGQPSLIRSVLQEIEKNNLISLQGLIFLEDSTEDPEISFEFLRLKAKNIRRFGTARLYELVQTE